MTSSAEMQEPSQTPRSGCFDGSPPDSPSDGDGDDAWRDDLPWWLTVELDGKTATVIVRALAAVVAAHHMHSRCTVPASQLLRAALERYGREADVRTLDGQRSMSEAVLQLLRT